MFLSPYSSKKSIHFSDFYFCKHCDNVIKSLSAASTHKCFLGHKNIYASDADSHVLFVVSEESEKPDTDDHLDEEPGDPENSSSSNNQQKCTLWTRQASLAMLSLYEANLH
ncbi:hypothetical protein PV328_012017 [Microctonus aethiopoides]|uniref:Uncharacterized protein n=1 Tax=Microctonus aethiopoides TaxID=144406 RepID=A0AA39FHC3_9HYME|nr:hypothetical protein PV328_012017 [Microctonus aethiopoides]